ncbi:phage head completion protein [Methylobacterium fujisawaense]
MDPGRFNRRAVVMRRAVVTDADGDVVGAGDCEPVMILWASYRPQGAREAAQGGRAQNVETGTLTICDSAQARPSRPGTASRCRPGISASPASTCRTGAGAMREIG